MQWEAGRRVVLVLGDLRGRTQLPAVPIPSFSRTRQLPEVISIPRLTYRGSPGLCFGGAEAT